MQFTPEYLHLREKCEGPETRAIISRHRENDFGYSVESVSMVLSSELFSAAITVRNKLKCSQIVDLFCYLVWHLSNQ